MANDTMSTPDLGLEIIQEADFYQRSSILHPVAVGSIAMIALFVALRLSSNRTIAPMTIFDWIINVAIGSTLAGIVNGNSLARGLEGLVLLLVMQYITSYASCNFGQSAANVLSSPPLLVVFRGRVLHKVMKKHRVSPKDLNASLRGAKILNTSQVEACILEPTGVFNVYRTDDMDPDIEPEVLLAVPAYKVLLEELEGGHEHTHKKLGLKPPRQQKNSPFMKKKRRKEERETEEDENDEGIDEQSDVHSESSTQTEESEETSSKDEKKNSDRKKSNVATHKPNADGEGSYEQATDRQNQIAGAQA